MGTSGSAAQLAGKLGKLAADLERAPQGKALAVGRVVGDAFYAEAMKSIRGANIAGRTWGTYARPARGGEGITYGLTGMVGAVIVGFRGPVHWFERGTVTHPIVSRRYGGSRAGRARKARDNKLGFVRGAGMGTPYGPRSVVWVGGMRARPFWARAKRAGSVAGGRVSRSPMLTDPLRRNFR